MRLPLTRTYWRAAALRTYATSSQPGAPAPVRKIVVPKPAKPANSTRTIPDATASSSATTAASTPMNKPVTPASSIVPPRKQPPAAQRPLNPASPEYKKAYNRAARRWMAALIALPIFIVTSYVLFNRIILGKERKVMPTPTEPEPA
ncbi:hypothetical protein SODALDRAFT_217358 [Sodiomyces alkalinus F11]|uniref:Uncharacterized protein n=1 Tax=Sodiomyces alkalinus (strain CBS 110278 / VKM F-3762 / F11) TaxID=1314773 RepID=A0A3N2PP85_SODAK|nr:hypothetical protein SODALDRAFT_217358 [Sodiomyces alkalinus F11]ROT36325.1 hypothetical protein SODALDRAFT_217358 [Sodiomyces alkalinus F11]